MSVPITTTQLAHGCDVVCKFAKTHSVVASYTLTGVNIVMIMCDPTSLRWSTEFTLLDFMFFHTFLNPLIFHENKHYVTECFCGACVCI